ncbi:MAG: LysE family transporter [Candidatus Paceibacterota bacterium]
MFLAQFITVAIVHLLAVVSPGPDFAMVARNSIIYSRKTGIYTAIGIAVGILVHVAYSLLGIGFVISKSVIIFNIVKFIGAGYLIYIGYKSLRAKPAVHTETKDNVAKQDISLWSSFKIGFLTNALNPKATLFFLALFTQIIDLSTPKIIQFAYGIEMMLITFVWFVLVALFFSNSLIRTKIGKVQHYVERVTGAVLIALGIKVALAGNK